MPIQNQFTPILDFLAQNLDIMPAVGGAVEDLLHPDVEELDDVLINTETREITEFQETPTPDIQHPYFKTPPIFRKDQLLYRFFIDGSIRSYFLATGVENNRTFPIELSQIGAAVIERDQDGNVHLFSSKHQILLLIPKGALGISDSVWNALSGSGVINDSFQLVDTTEKSALNPHDATPENLRNRAGGVSRNRMHKLEIEVISDTDGIRDENNWVVLDGAVKIDEFVRVPNLIGVAKNFRKDPVFKFGRSSQARKDISTLLAGLPFGYRTAAFSSFNGKVAFWYLRMRDQGEVDYPLMGVVKVELPCPDQQPVPKDKIDLISRTLIAERNVTPHGRDLRWHCHLYPIFQAEEAIKNRFYSRDVLMGMIRWPKPNLMQYGGSNA